jgi:hypothetical protein
MNQEPRILDDHTWDETTLSTPHFDAEAVSAARPVMPLASFRNETPVTRTAVRPAPRRRSWIWAVFIASALGGGVAGAFIVGFYRRQPEIAARATTALLSSLKEQAARATEPSETAEPTGTIGIASPGRVSAGTGSAVPAIVKRTVEAVTQRAEAGSALRRPPTEPDGSAVEPPQSKEPRPLQITAAPHQLPAGTETISQNQPEDESPVLEATTVTKSPAPSRVETRPRRVEAEEGEFAPEPPDEEPGPRRIDRIRDIFTGHQP